MAKKPTKVNLTHQQISDITLPKKLEQQESTLSPLTITLLWAAVGFFVAVTISLVVYLA